MGRKQTEETKRKISERAIKRYNGGKFKDKHGDIINLYKSGKSAKDVGQIIGCSNTIVLNVLIAHGIERRRPGSKYLINDDFFNTIDTEKKAYWLGMIATDGTIRKNKNRNEIVLSLKIEDVIHIEKFLKDIGSSSKVYYTTRNGSKQAYASICSKQLKKSLINLGITPNKSLTIVPPKLPKCLERHFWRGCIDGDGSIFRAKKEIAWHCSYNGTFEMVNQFVKFLQNNGIAFKKPYKRGNIYSVSYDSKESVKNLLNLLYSNAIVFLDRKFNKARQAIEEIDVL